MGDKVTDVQFGIALGTRTALIRSRYWSEDSLDVIPDIIADSLHDAELRRRGVWKDVVHRFSQIGQFRPQPGRGVFLNIGSAVTGPEVYLKALSMARNVAHQENEEIRHITTAVFDLVDLLANFREGPPPKDHPLFYYRPWKTILCRTVADGGTSHYIRGDHRQTIPALWNLLG